MESVPSKAPRPLKSTITLQAGIKGAVQRNRQKFSVTKIVASGAQSLGAKMPTAKKIVVAHSRDIPGRQSHQVSTLATNLKPHPNLGEAMDDSYSKKTYGSFQDRQTQSQIGQAGRRQETAKARPVSKKQQQKVSSLLAQPK